MKKINITQPPTTTAEDMTAQQRYQAKLKLDADKAERNRVNRAKAQAAYKARKAQQGEKLFSVMLEERLHKPAHILIDQLKKEK